MPILDKYIFTINLRIIWVLLNVSSGTVFSARRNFVTRLHVRPQSVQNFSVPQLVERHSHAAEEDLDRLGIVSLG